MNNVIKLDPLNFPSNDPSLNFFMQHTHGDLLSETESLISALEGTYTGFSKDIFHTMLVIIIITEVLLITLGT